MDSSHTHGVHICLTAALGALFVCSAVAPAAAQEESRIRLVDPSVRATFRDVYDHSASFRALVASLEQSDVIVFVAIEPPPAASMDGATRLMTTAAGQRYLRVSIRRTLSARSTMAMLAHELTHAGEVAQAPAVRTSGEMSKLFRRIGFNTTGERYETERARRMTDVVLREFDESLRAARAIEDEHHPR